MLQGLVGCEFWRWWRDNVGCRVAEKRRREEDGCEPHVACGVNGKSQILRTKKEQLQRLFKREVNRDSTRLGL